MTFLSDNKPFTVLLIYVGLLLIFALSTALIFVFLPEAETLQGVFIGWTGGFATLVTKVAIDFGLDGKPNN